MRQFLILCDFICRLCSTPPCVQQSFLRCTGPLFTQFLSADSCKFSVKSKHASSCVCVCVFLLYNPSVFKTPFEVVLTFFHSIFFFDCLNFWLKSSRFRLTAIKTHLMVFNETFKLIKRGPLPLLSN